MAAEFCPRCGRARTGAFRFCRDCGFDFDTATATARMPVPSATPDSPMSPAPPQAAPMSRPPQSFTEKYRGSPSLTGMAVESPAASDRVRDTRGEVSPLVSPAGAALGAVKLSDRQWSGVAGAGGLVIAVAAMLPWVTVTAGVFGSVSKNGLDAGDGFLFLAAGIIIGLLGLSGATVDPQRVRRWLLGLGVLGALGGLAEYVVEYSRINGLDPEASALTAVGIGIYLIVVGGLLVLYAAWRIHPE